MVLCLWWPGSTLIAPAGFSVLFTGGQTLTYASRKIYCCAKAARESCKDTTRLGSKERHDLQIPMTLLMLD